MRLVQAGRARTREVAARIGARHRPSTPPTMIAPKAPRPPPRHRQDDHATVAKRSPARSASRKTSSAGRAHDRGWRAVDERRPPPGQIDDTTLARRAAPGIWTDALSRAPRGPYVAPRDRHFDLRRGAAAKKRRGAPTGARDKALPGGRDRAALDADYTWVRALDWISLVVCLRDLARSPRRAGSPPRARERARHALVGPPPRPRWGAPSRGCALERRARDLPADAERSDTALQRAWRAATPQELTFVVSPGEPTR